MIGMNDAEAISRLLPALEVIGVHVRRVADALSAGYTVACYCGACGRWAALDLRRMIANGQGERPIAALRVRCATCADADFATLDGGDQLGRAVVQHFAGPSD